MKSAIQHSFAGQYFAGPRMVQIVTTDANGRVTSTRNIPAADKAEALAIAKREGAVFTA